MLDKYQIDDFTRYEFYKNGDVFAKNRGLFLKGSYGRYSGDHYYNLSSDSNPKLPIKFYKKNTTNIKR
mgnify:CR=1 FL=1